MCGVVRNDTLIVQQRDHHEFTADQARLVTAARIQTAAALCAKQLALVSMRDTATFMPFTRLAARSALSVLTGMPLLFCLTCFIMTKRQITRLKRSAVTGS
jgi:hypothetical protein